MERRADELGIVTQKPVRRAIESLTLYCDIATNARACPLSHLATQLMARCMCAVPSRGILPQVATTPNPRTFGATAPYAGSDHHTN